MSLIGTTIFYLRLVGAPLPPPPAQSYCVLDKSLEHRYTVKNQQSLGFSARPTSGEALIDQHEMDWLPRIHTAEKDSMCLIQARVAT